MYNIIMERLERQRSQDQSARTVQNIEYMKVTTKRYVFAESVSSILYEVYLQVEHFSKFHSSRLIGAKQVGHDDVILGLFRRQLNLYRSQKCSQHIKRYEDASMQS